MKTHRIIFLIAIAASATATAAERPNVLLIVSDDLTACLGCYGNDVCETPNLDRLAREGVLFKHAYCQYPVCGPSRASFMSGLYPNTTKMLRNNYKTASYKATNPKLADHPSIGGLLKNNGYFSARVSKIYHMGIPGGIEAGEAGGDEPDSWDWTYNVLAPETYSPGKFELLTPQRPHFGSNFATIRVPNDRIATQADVMASRQAVAILESRAGDRPDVKTRDNRIKPEAPFFLAVGLIRPHVPLVAPERLFDKYPAADIKLPDVPEGDLEDIPEPAARMRNKGRYDMNQEQQRKAIAGYYASVSFMDEQVGRLLNALDRLKIRDNTIVIFTSDHGYNLGEHRCWQKLSLFEESTRVPLLISVPGFDQSAGQSADGIVELIDLYPTIADLVGLKKKAPKNLQGQSLRPLLENPSRSDWKNIAYTVTYRNGESIRTHRWRYNRWGEAGEELYDHQQDPNEFTNLANSPNHTDILQEMRALLESKRRGSTSK